MKYIISLLVLVAFLRVDLTCCDVCVPQSTAGLVECLQNATVRQGTLSIACVELSGILKSDYVDKYMLPISSKVVQKSTGHAKERQTDISKIHFMNSYHNVSEDVTLQEIYVTILRCKKM